MLKSTLKERKSGTGYFFIKNRKKTKLSWIRINSKLKLNFLNYKVMNTYLKKGVLYSNKIKKTAYYQFIYNYSKLS